MTMGLVAEAPGWNSAVTRSRGGESRAAKLAALRVRYNSIAPGEVLSAEEAVARLRENRLENYDGSARRLSLRSVQLLASALEQNWSLRILNLWGASIGAQGAEVVGRWLARSRTIEGMDLRQNELGPDGMRHVGFGLASNSSLLHLSLGSNGARPRGGALVADGLASAGARSKLAILDLDSNGLGVSGGAEAARILASSVSLVHLNLSFNLLGDAGLAHLVPGLTASSSLASLNLRSVGISPLGASILADVVANVQLSSLDAAQNDFGEQGLELILAARDRSPTLDALLLDALTEEPPIRPLFFVDPLFLASRDPLCCRTSAPPP